MLTGSQAACIMTCTQYPRTSGCLLFAGLQKSLHLCLPYCHYSRYCGIAMGISAEAIPVLPPWMASKKGLCNGMVQAPLYDGLCRQLGKDQYR